MPNKNMVAIVGGGLLVYSGWVDANATAATATQQFVGWAAVAIGALLIFQNMRG